MPSPSPRIAVVFPGQGAQAVGMGQNLADTFSAAKAIFDTFDTVTGLNLSDVTFNGPKETLTQTQYTQPAILATSLAAYQVFIEQTNLVPSLAAGHSLGEYGALYAAGVITIDQAASLIHQRATLMSEAQTTSQPGAMAAVLGSDAKTVDSVIQAYLTEHPDTKLCVANDNSPSQQVISGEAAAVDAVIPMLKEAGAKRVMPLAVSGAFHSPLMTPAAEAFAKFVKPQEFWSAQFPVITNVDSALTTEPEAFKTKLGTQIDHSVRWTQTMDTMINDAQINTVIEFGPGHVLTGLFKKFDAHLTTYNVNDVASLEAVINALKTPEPAV